MSPVDQDAIERVVTRAIVEHPVVGLAVGVVHDDAMVYFRGHGLADVATANPVTADTGFRIASITKTLTAVAVMQLWEQGLVDLDGPANDYLTSFRLVPHRPGDPPATVRHLLTHTAGLPEVAHPSGIFRADFGESVPLGRPLPSLAEFYGGEIRLLAPPGDRFVYGNHSPATLGQIVADVSGEPLDRYFRDHLFAPLGMTHTDLVRTGEVSGRLATGYEIGSGGVETVAERDMVTAGAASVFSTPRDMYRYMAALLGGASGRGRILRAETVATMFAPHHQPDPRVPGLGLAFWRYDLSGRLVVGHQGTHPGFHSQILMAPEHGVGVMLFTNGASQADFWLPALGMRILRAALALPDDDGRASVPHRPGVWEEIRGWYRLSAGLTDVRLRGMMGFGAEVSMKDGRPLLRFLTPVPTMYRGFPLLADDEKDPYVFALDLGSGLEPMRAVFAAGAEGGVDRLHFGMMPLTLHRAPAGLNPRLWASGAATGLGLALAAKAMRRRGRAA